MGQMEYLMGQMKYLMGQFDGADAIFDGVDGADEIFDRADEIFDVVCWYLMVRTPKFKFKRQFVYKIFETMTASTSLIIFFQLFPSTVLFFFGGWVCIYYFTAGSILLKI